MDSFLQGLKEGGSVAAIHRYVVELEGDGNAGTEGGSQVKYSCWVLKANCQGERGYYKRRGARTLRKMLMRFAPCKRARSVKPMPIL